MKEITIVPSDKCIKELYELEQKLKYPREMGGESHLSFEEFYRKHKQPRKALFG